MIAYAQHRALERIADNLHGIMEVLACDPGSITSLLS